MKNSHYYPHSGGILGCHAYVDFQQTNYLLNVIICEKFRCAHKLQTISDAFNHIASRFLKVALAIKFALNWLAAPQYAVTSQRHLNAGWSNGITRLYPAVRQGWGGQGMGCQNRSQKFWGLEAISTWFSSTEMYELRRSHGHRPGVIASAFLARSVNLDGDQFKTWLPSETCAPCTGSSMTPFT